MKQSKQRKQEERFLRNRPPPNFAVGIEKIMEKSA